MKEIELLAKTKPWDWIITFHPDNNCVSVYISYQKIFFMIAADNVF